jgi:hypothetical protein
MEHNMSKIAEKTKIIIKNIKKTFCFHLSLLTPTGEHGWIVGS